MQIKREKSLEDGSESLQDGGAYSLEGAVGTDIGDTL